MARARPEYTEEDCRRYIRATKGRRASDLLRRAMDLAGARGRALELGCGAGDDAAAMLARGFRVTAVDEHRAALDALSALVRRRGLARGLTVRRSKFEDLVFTPGVYELVNARYSLPFCAPKSFPMVWKGIRGSLRPGGILACQLFGPKDSFLRTIGARRINAHTRARVNRLLSGLIVHHLDEIQEDGRTAAGSKKYWHVFHILAQKPL